MRVTSRTRRTKRSPITTFKQALSFIEFYRGDITIKCLAEHVRCIVEVGLIGREWEYERGSVEAEDVIIKLAEEIRKEIGWM